MFPQKQQIDALNAESMNNLLNDLERWLGTNVIKKKKLEQSLTANENYQLARKYYHGGRGKPQDGSEAVKYYRKAAEQGSTVAQYELAVCLFNGNNGVLKDYEEAKKWFEAASIDGHSQAQSCLSDMYYYGICTPKNLYKARYWIVASLQSGNLYAKEKLDSFDNETLHIMSADDMNSIGDLYYKGDELIPIDYLSAVIWYSRAVEKGHAKAMFNLAICHYKGKGVKQNFEEAVKLFFQSIENGCFDAYYTLGKCFERGNGVSQDVTKAVHYYQLASEQGDTEAKKELGFRYMKGDGVPENYSEALKYFTQIPNKSSIIAFEIGYCFEHLDDDKQNIESAMKWYKKSAEMGEDHAIEAYNRLYQRFHNTNL